MVFSARRFRVDRPSGVHPKRVGIEDIGYVGAHSPSEVAAYWYAVSIVVAVFGQTVLQLGSYDIVNHRRTTTETAYRQFSSKPLASLYS